MANARLTPLVIIVRGIKAIGYRYVTIDLQGYRTGRLNEALLLRPA